MKKIQYKKYIFPTSEDLMCSYAVRDITNTSHNKDFLWLT